MTRIIKKLSKTAGLAPGTLIHVGDEKGKKPKISIIDYNETNFQEKVVKEAEECFSFKDTPTVTWTNVDGISDVEIIEKIGNCFQLHPLILEDIANTFKGVEKSYAIQAGREIRILVKPEEIDDLGAMRLARDIVKKIEEGLEYPGQIKVTVLRETRAIDYAK